MLASVALQMAPAPQPTLPAHSRKLFVVMLGHWWRVFEFVKSSELQWDVGSGLGLDRFLQPPQGADGGLQPQPQGESNATALNIVECFCACD